MKQKQVCVLGLGDTGLSMVRWAHEAGALVRVADTRDVPPMLEALRVQFPDVKFYSGPFSAAVFEGVDRLLVSPGVSLMNPAIQAVMGRGISADGDIELFVV